VNFARKVSMKQIDGTKMKAWHVYRYDIKKGTWVDEGEIKSKERNVYTCKRDRQ